MNKKIIMLVVGLVLLGAGFGGGILFRNYQLSKARGSFTGANGAQRFVGGVRSGQGSANGAGGAVVGSILSADATSITVKLANGSTKIVLLSGTTTYANTVSASQSALSVGSNVAVFGTANSDGSLTATSVQINPEFGRVQPVISPAPGQ